MWKTPGILGKTPGIPWKPPRIPFKTPGIMWKTPGIPRKTPGILFKTPGVPWKSPRIPWKSPGIVRIPALSPAQHSLIFQERGSERIPKLERPLGNDAGQGFPIFPVLGVIPDVLDLPGGSFIPGDGKEIPGMEEKILGMEEKFLGWGTNSWDGEETFGIEKELLE